MKLCYDCAKMYSCVTEFQSMFHCMHYTKRPCDDSSFYPRDAMLARVFVIVTCPSVCLSVTSRYCAKTKKASGMISSPSGSPMILVFWCQIHHKILRGSPRAGASKKDGVGQFSDFLALSVNISKTVADIRPKLLLVTNRKSHIGFPLTPRSMTLDDLELL